MSNERSGFSSRLGFVLATAGSAVGLGNIWRFPYLAAKYGGGTFLLTYLILTLTFGFSLMITEVALGRKAGTSAIRAFGHFSKKHTFIGYLTTIIPFIIFPYYCVIVDGLQNMHWYRFREGFIMPPLIHSLQGLSANQQNL